MPKSIIDRIKENRKKHPNSFKRVSTIDSWLNGDGHTKRRESPPPNSHAVCSVNY